MPDDNKDLYRFLGRIEGKVDAVLKAQEAQHSRLQGHSGRLDDLERSRDKVRGAGRILAFVLAPGAGLTAALIWLKDLFSNTPQGG